MNRWKLLLALAGGAALFLAASFHDGGMQPSGTCRLRAATVEDESGPCRPMRATLDPQEHDAGAVRSDRCDPLEAVEDATASAVSLLEELHALVRGAASVREAAALLEARLRDDPLLVARLILLIRSGKLQPGPARGAVTLAIAALPDERFETAKHALWKALDQSTPRNAPPAVETMREALASIDTAEVVQSLALVDERHLRDGLILDRLKALASEEGAVEVRRRAIDALARASRFPEEDPAGQEIERFLRDLLERPLSVSLEAAAARALSLCRGEAVAAVLEGVLADPTRSPDARRFAAAGMRLQPKSESGARRLIDSYRSDPDPDVRISALLSMATFARTSEDVLLELLFAVRSDSDVDHRRTAALALTGVPDPRVEAALVAASSLDPVASVREAAAVALRAWRARSQSVASR
jgi:hypothetical protein